MISDNLFNKILISPVTSEGARELLIVSGYATPAMASYHADQVRQLTNGVDISISVIVGMTARDGIPQITHSGFVSLVEERADLFECRYIIKGLPVHSKAYLWKDINTAYMGSANYTQTAFLGRSREVLTKTAPEEVATYYESLASDTMPCNHPDILNKIKLTRRSTRPELAGPPEDEIITDPESPVINMNGLLKATLKFIDNNGMVPERSGLNWGQRPGRDPNQAYISIRRTECPEDFFPPRYRHLTIRTDDGFTFNCHIAQERGKAIHTPDNAELGRYFRRRLSVPLGDRVEIEHLRSYGRTDVDFYKIDDETYYMDFSIST